jgi:hypothetical protein
MKGDSTQMNDLAGKTFLPGFLDAHTVITPIHCWWPISANYILHHPDQQKMLKASLLLKNLCTGKKNTERRNNYGLRIR